MMGPAWVATSGARRDFFEKKKKFGKKSSGKKKKSRKKIEKKLKNVSKKFWD